LRNSSNVDRLFAIWQALNWKKWWDASDSSSHPDEEKTDNRTSPLEPFHFKDEHDQVNTYASDTCRDWTKFGYTYDDLDNAVSDGVLDGSKRLRESLYIAALRKNLSFLYPGSAHAISAIRQSDRLTPPGLDKPEDQYGPDGGRWQDYIVNISYDRYALAGKAYSIEFHLGGNENDPSSIWAPHNFVGKVYTFSNAQTEACPNCTTQQEHGVLSRAQVPITLHLIHHVIDNVPGHNLGSFFQDDVERYLVDNLHWRFIELGGKELAADKFPKTEIEVFVGQGEVLKPEDRHPDEKESPAAKFTNYSSLLKASNGKLVRVGGE
jgi:tyrosinase